MPDSFIKQDAVTEGNIIQIVKQLRADVERLQKSVWSGAEQSRLSRLNVGPDGAQADQGDLVVDGDIYAEEWTDYSGISTIVGWSTFTSKFLDYKKVGNLVFVEFDLRGTSNSTAVTFTLPYASGMGTGRFAYGVIRVRDNSGTITVGDFFLPSGTSTVTCRPAPGGGGWTASGTKEVLGQFWYEAA